MKSTSLQRVFLATFLVAPLIMTGCKSNMWKPSSMFAWGKDTPPANSEFELPVSPATKFTPNAVASVGAGSGSGTRQNGAQQSPYGYSPNGPAVTQGNSLAAKANGFPSGSNGFPSGSNGFPSGSNGFPSGTASFPAGTTGGTSSYAAAAGGRGATPGLPSAGLPSATGGYRTGPYPTGTASAGTNLPNTANFASSAKPSGSLPNPYGAPRSGAKAPNITLPNSVTNAIQASRNTTPYTGMPNAGGTSTGLRAQPAVGSPTTGNSQLPSYSSPALPKYPSATSRQPSTASGNIPNSSAYSANAGTTNLSYPGSSSRSPSMGLPPASQGLPGVGTGGSSTAPASFTPGTTARSTKYNFGN